MIVQGFIFLFSALAIWLVARKDKWQRWGYIAGLIGQPFWFYETITNNQMGMLALTLFYSYAWGKGVYNYWIKKN